VVELTNVGMQLGGRTLFSHLNLNFAAAQRIGVFGRNGLGKTTLLKLILGQIEPTHGTVKIGMLTKFNYVDQGRLQLNEDRTVLEEISDGSEFVIFGEHKLSLRAYLKRFLFTDDRITTQVKHLSGGERSRLLLARILKNGGNFLILDEPTNDLDLATLRVLEEALLAFEGVVVVVSHDRYFLNRVCTGIVAFEGDGRVVYSEGNYDYYLEKKQRALQPISSPREGNPSAAAAAKSTPAGRPRKLNFKETKELEGMEQTIAAVEEEISRIENLFGDPDFNRKYGQQMDDLNAELTANKAKLNALFARWEELEAIRAGAEAGQQT
jgi:ATP-binding cassette subfamily F protein uup